MKKKGKQHIYTQQELLAQLPYSANNITFEGLHIYSNANFEDFALLNAHFRSDFFAIFMVLKGQVEGSLNLQPFTTQKNDLLIAPPSTIKQLIKSSPSAKGIGIGFTIDFLSKAGVPKHSFKLFDYLATQESPIWHLSPADALLLEDLFLQLFYRCQQVNIHPFGKEQLYANFLIFLFELAAQHKKYGAKIFKQLSRKEETVMQFANLVREQFRTQRSVQHYAALLSITAKYLTETVKEVSGRNAGEIIDDFVIVESKFLLENPEYSIAQIAGQLHFSDQSFFGKFFKRHVGMSPKEFRNSRLA